MTIKSVVVADDEPHLAHILAYTLKKAGMTVHVACNGAECIKLAAEVQPDLIVSDFQMPVLDGLAACVKMKHDPRTAHIPVLMLTARGHRLTEQELSQTNIRGVLPKPFSARQLVEKIASFEQPTDTQRVAA